MIRQRLWAPFAALILSCHAPSGAQNRATDGPKASAQEFSHLLGAETTLAVTAPPVASTRATAVVPVQSPRPAKKAEPADTPLCCDMPSGLCYPDDGVRCVTETSRMIECPAVSVREITNGFVVCAD